MTADPSGRTVDTAARLRGWLAGEARIARATQPLREGLDQREHYTDLRGIKHPLSAMSAAEASLVLALLDRYALALHRGELAERLLRLKENGWQPEAGIQAYEALAATPAEEWIHQTPLHRALTERTSQ